MVLSVWDWPLRELNHKSNAVQSRKKCQLGWLSGSGRPRSDSHLTEQLSCGKPRKLLMRQVGLYQESLLDMLNGLHVLNGSVCITIRQNVAKQLTGANIMD
ncbi:hypothetical protein J6590_023770 [Homalodisca vitripennis]|nr:hypothetical protein J6590_023770 [Homalodisca vitripennis]